MILFLFLKSESEFLACILLFVSFFVSIFRLCATFSCLINIGKSDMSPAKYRSKMTNTQTAILVPSLSYPPPPSPLAMVCRSEKLICEAFCTASGCVCLRVVILCAGSSLITSAARPATCRNHLQQNIRNHLLAVSLDSLNTSF